MNIIILTGFYHPYLCPSANCINPYFQKLAELGHSIDIICPSSQWKSSQNESNFNIHYITNLTNSIRCYCNYRLNNNTWSSFIWKGLIQLVRLWGVATYSFSYPTSSGWMIKKYIKKIEEIMTYSQIDVIISVSAPPCTHLAAMFVKNKYPDIKWITYSFDPFTFQPIYYRFVFAKRKRRQKNFRNEKQIYENADYNVFTKELYDNALSSFGVTNKKAKIILYTINYYKIEGHKVENPKLTFLYAGDLRKKIRNPQKLLSIISKIPDYYLRLYVAGDCDDIIRNYKSSNIEVHGFIPRDQYLYMIYYCADILINIGNSNSLQSPSKFMELISTGHPLVNFYSRKDVCYDMTEKYPLGLNVNQYGDINIDFFRAFCEKVRGVQISRNELLKIFPDNCMEKQFYDLCKMLNCNTL